MKKSKIVILVGFVLAVLIIRYIFFVYHWSDNAEKGRKNISNSRKVKSQMNREDILSIMGKPDTLIQGRFCYNTNDDSYPYIEFSFDSLGKVEEIYSPDK